MPYLAHDTCSDSTKGAILVPSKPKLSRNPAADFLIFRHLGSWQFYQTLFLHAPISSPNCDATCNSFLHFRTYPTTEQIIPLLWYMSAGKQRRDHYILVGKMWDRSRTTPLQAKLRFDTLMTDLGGILFKYRDKKYLGEAPLTGVCFSWHFRGSWRPSRRWWIV